MTHAKHGDTVKVHYTGKFKDGTIFDTSVDREPLQVTLGEGRLLPGIEQTVIGMHPGVVKTIEIPSEQAYGPYREDLVLVIARDQFPEHLTPQVHQQLELTQENGQTMVVRVSEVSESTVTLDANHPLAGQDLTFEIELLEIR